MTTKTKPRPKPGPKATKPKATKPKATKPKATKAKPKPEAPEADWWAVVPTIPKTEPDAASITFNDGKAAKQFAAVLNAVAESTEMEGARPVLNCVQMQTAEGLRLAAADGFRLAVAEYRPGLNSDILARPALFARGDVTSIVKVLKGATGNGWAKLEVKRDAERRILTASNNKGLMASALERSGNFPSYQRLIPVERGAKPAALNARYLQWAGRFCQAVTCDGGGIARIRQLHPTNPCRFDATSDGYQGVAIIMPMYVELG